LITGPRLTQISPYYFSHQLGRDRSGQLQRVFEVGAVSPSAEGLLTELGPMA